MKHICIAISHNERIKIDSFFSLPNKKIGASFAAFCILKLAEESFLYKVDDQIIFYINDLVPIMFREICKYYKPDQAQMKRESFDKFKKNRLKNMRDLIYSNLENIVPKVPELTKKCIGTAFQLNIEKVYSYLIEFKALLEPFMANSLFQNIKDKSCYQQISSLLEPSKIRQSTRKYSFVEEQTNSTSHSTVNPMLIDASPHNDASQTTPQQATDTPNLPTTTHILPKDIVPLPSFKGQQQFIPSSPKESDIPLSVQPTISSSAATTVNHDKDMNSLESISTADPAKIAEQLAHQTSVINLILGRTSNLEKQVQELTLALKGSNERFKKLEAKHNLLLEQSNFSTISSSSTNSKFFKRKPDSQLNSRSKYLLNNVDFDSDESNDETDDETPTINVTARP